MSNLKDGNTMTEKIRYNIKDALLRDSFYDSDELMILRNNPTRLIDRGYEYIEQGEYSKAFRIFTTGAEIDRTDPDILNGLGIALCELGLLEEARSVLDYAIITNPDDPVIHANMAGVLWEQCEFQNAIHYYVRSIELDPEIEETFFNLINLYMDSGYLFMAFITCRRFLDRCPDHKEGLELMEEIILSMGISLT